MIDGCGKLWREIAGNCDNLIAGKYLTVFQSVYAVGSTSTHFASLQPSLNEPRLVKRLESKLL